ncbi:T3SS effector HopA1 family protein, partial [Nocardia sp. NPDC060259]|uniref:WXG100-like domain-containing protein n=1 Tax=Nocardia sp. NPDC060259 TaxID=3347088 RepID=UPI003655C341
MAELPAALAWLKYPAGMEWPEGDEDQLWGLSGDWKNAADELRAILDDIDAAKAASLTAYPVGQGVEEMIKGFDSMRTGDGGDKDQSLEKLAETFDEVAKSVFDAGTEIEYTKIMFVSSLALLAAEIALCWVPPTPASPALQAVAIGITRVAVRILGQALVRALVRVARQAFIKAMLKFLARHVAIDFILGTMQELGTQAWQVSQGHRDEINHRQLLVTMVSSAAGGAAAGPFAGLLGDKLIKDRMNKWLKAAITGPAAGLMGAEAGNVAAIATQLGIDWHDTGSFDKAWDNATKAFMNHDPLMFTAGASNGLLSSLSGTGAHTWKAGRAGATPGVDTMSAPSLSDQIDAIVGIDRSDGAGEGDGGATRDDGATRTDDGAGEGDTRTRSDDDTGVGENRAGDGTGDGANTSRDDGPVRTSGASGLGSGGGGGDGSTMRPAAASSGDGESGGRGESEGAGERKATADDEGARAGEAADTRRNGEDSPTGEAAADQNRVDADGRTGAEPTAENGVSHRDSVNTPEAQRAGVPLGADALQGGDLGVRGAADSTTPVTGAADSTATRADSTTAAPVVTQAAPAAASSPAPAAQAPAAGETRGAPASSAPARGVAGDLRTGTGPEADSALRTESGDGVTDATTDTTVDRTADSSADADGDATADPTRADAPDRETAAPKAADSRAGLADGGLTGADSQPTVRADHADSEVPQQRQVAETGETRTAEPGTPEAGVAPILPITPGTDAPARTPRRRAGVPINDPGPTGADPADRSSDRPDRSADPDTGTTDRTADYDHLLPNGQRVVYTPTATSIGNDTSTDNVRNNLRNEGMHDVIVHGTRSGHPNPGHEGRVDPAVIAQTILDNPSYVRGTPVRLMSCHAGADGSWAQQLADLIGATVHAPTKEVGTRNLPDQPAELVGGEWRSFEPGNAVAADDGAADSAGPRTDFGDLTDDQRMGEQGRSRAELEAALGGPLHDFPDPGGNLPRHQGIVDELMRMAADADPRDIARGAGPRAFVVDQFVSPGQGLLVGGAPYAMVLGLDPATGQHRVDILDPRTGARHPYPLPTPRDLHTVSAVLMDSNGNPVQPRGLDPRQAPAAPDRQAPPSDPRSPAADPRLAFAADRGKAGAGSRDGVRLLDPDEAYDLGRTPGQGDGVPPRPDLDVADRADDVVDHIRRTLSEPGALDPGGDLRNLRDQLDALVTRLDGELGDRLAPSDPATRRAVIADAMDQLLSRNSPETVRDAIRDSVRDHSPWEPLSRNDTGDIADPPVRFYSPDEAYEAGRNPDLERDAPFGPAADGDGALRPANAGPPRTLDDLRRAHPDLSFDELRDLRDASYRDAGMEPPPLSRESLDNLLDQVWANRDSINDAMDVYRLYSDAPEPNTVSDAQAYTRAIADIVDNGSDVRRAMLQAGMNLPMQPGESDVLSLMPWHFVHFQRTGELGRIPVDYRVYVNPRIDAAPALMRDLVRDIIDRPDAFPGVRTAKITSPTAERSDAIVVYVRDMADVEQVTQWLRDYRDRNGDVFLFDAPPMTQQVLDGVGIGAHPKGQSFGHVRAVAIQRALDTVMANGGTYADFLAEVQRVLPGAGVDPDSPHLRHDPDAPRSWPDRSGLDRMGADEPAGPAADGDPRRSTPSDRGRDETPEQAARRRAEQADAQADAAANRANFLHGLADSVANGGPLTRDGDSVDAVRGRAWQADWDARQQRADADQLWQAAGGRPENPAAVTDPRLAWTANPADSAPADPRAGRTPDAPAATPDRAPVDPRLGFRLEPEVPRTDSQPARDNAEPVRFYSPEEAYEAGRNPDLERDAPFGPAVDGDGPLPADAAPPRTLDDLRRAHPDLSFDDLLGLREAAYRDAGMEPPPLSRESLDSFLDRVWAAGDAIRTTRDIYDLYSLAHVPNSVTDPGGYVRALADILVGNPDLRFLMLQGIHGPGMVLPETVGDLGTDFHFLHFNRPGADFPVGYRVYVNPRIDAAPEMMRNLVRDILLRPDDFPGVKTMKVTGPEAQRSDAIVIYTRDLAAAQQVSSWLRDCRDRAGDVFLWDAPAMTNQVLEGVGLGEHQSGESFGDVRSVAIRRALDIVRANGGDFADFHAEVLRQLPSASVDPATPHRNAAPDQPQAWPPRDGFDRMGSPDDDSDSGRTPQPGDGDSGRTPPPDDRTARGDDDETPEQAAARLRAQLADLRADVAANRAEFLHDLADSMRDSDPRTRDGESPESVRGRAWQADWNARQLRADADLLWTSTGGRLDASLQDPRLAYMMDPTASQTDSSSGSRADEPAPPRNGARPDPRLAYMMDRPDGQSTPDPRREYMMDPTASQPDSSSGSRADGPGTPRNEGTPDPRLAFMMDRPDGQTPDPRRAYMMDRSDTTPTDPRRAYMMDPENPNGQPDSGNRGPTPELAAADDWAKAEYDRLMEERNRLAREMEFWRAKRDDRVTRLMGITDVELAVGSRDNLANTMRRLAAEADSQSTRVAPIGEEPGTRVNQRRSEADAAHRRETAAKLDEAARRVIEMREQLAALDRRIAELQASGAIDGRPTSAEDRAELDRLARQRANELLRIKPRRAMRDDLAERLGLADADGALDESLLSPENLAGTIDALREADPGDRTGEIDALAEAARDVNEAHNRIGRLQDEMALVAGAARADIEGAGGRMLTRDIGLIDGDPPRLVVYGPRDQLGYQPRQDGLTDHELTLRRALGTVDDVVRAFVRDHGTIEFRRITADREGNARVDPMPDDTPQLQRRTIDYTISDVRGGNVRIEVARWRSADGTWHDVDPERTRQTQGRGSDETPDVFEGRMLPEGTSSVGVTPTQAAIVDAIAGSSGPGVNDAFIPKLPGGLSPANPGLESHSNDVPDAASNLMRMILETMKFAGWSWFQDPNDPTRIKPGFKRKRLFRRFRSEQQPFVTPPQSETTFGRTDPTEAARTSAAREQRRAAWSEVQRWADEQYDAFLRDDSDVTAIADTLRQQHADAQRAQARDMVDRIRTLLDEAETRMPGDDPAHRRRVLIDNITALVGDPDVRFTRDDTDADQRREQVGKVLGWIDAGVHPDVIADSIAHEFPTRIPELTPEQVHQIKRLLMSDALLMNDPDSGERRWRGLDRLPEVAEAWNRLAGRDLAELGELQPGDLALIRDAWEWVQRARASYDANDFTRGWDEFQDWLARSDGDDPTANQRRFAILTWEEIQNQVNRLPGDHWDDNRTPLTGPRAKVPYEPPLPSVPGRPTPEIEPGRREEDGPEENGPEAAGGVPAGDPPSRPPAAPGQTRPDPYAPGEFDRMGDGDPDDGADPTPARTADQDPVPDGMYRGEDGRLHQPGDRDDSYRDPDGRLHHVDDEPNTYRDKNFGYHDARTHWFIDDHLAAAEYDYLVMKGDSHSYDVTDPRLAQELRDVSTLRLALQAERDPIGAQIKLLMAEFEIERIADLSTDRLGGEIQRQTAKVEADASLSEADLIDKLGKLADLEDLATKYNDLGPELVEASKQLGELAGLAFTLDGQLRPGAVLLSPFDGAFDGAGTVDIASLVPGVGDAPPTLVVVEAKGVGSTLGGSKTARAEQGSPEYLRRTLAMDRNLAVILNETPAQLAARGVDPDSPAGRALIDAVRELRAAQADGTLRVEYHLVHASARGEVTVTELLLERDGVNILADVPLPIAALDTMGADDEVIHRLGDHGDEVPLPRDGQPYGWLLTPPDPTTAEVRELLGRTETGAEMLAVLDSVDARVRFGTFDDPAPTTFDGRAMEVFVGADGPDRITQADAVVRAGALADAVLGGRLETTPSQIRALDRAEHIAARVRAEAEAFGRQAEFHREVDAAGHDPLSGTGRDPVDTAVRRTLDAAYLAAYDDAIAAAAGREPAPTPEQLRDLGREAGVARLLEHELFDTPDGFGRRDEAAAEWDAHRTPEQRPGLAEFVPSDRDTARELERLMREQAAATRTVMRVEADWDRVCDRLVRGFNLPVDELPSTRRGIADMLLVRASDVGIWHGMDNAMLLTDLTAQHIRASVDRARLVDEITDLVRADLAGRADAPADANRVRVHGDETGVLYVLRDAEASHAANELAAASWLADPAQTREALAQAGVAHAALVDRVDRLYLEPLGMLEPPRGVSWERPGRWAAQQLAERGVSVRYSIEPEFRFRRGSATDPGTAPAYDPATNTLVLDRDADNLQQAVQLVFAARMADLLAAADGLPERFTLGRDEYVDRMSDRVADALALSFQFDTVYRRHGESVDETSLRRAYAEAYENGLRTATKAYAKLGSVTTDELFHAAAHRAGVRAVRAVLAADGGPRLDARSYPDHFGADWDRAHGITPPPPGADTGRADGPAPAARKDARAPYLAMEIETLRAMRDRGGYIPVGPAEQAYTNACDKAYAKAERARQRNADAPPPERVAAEAGRDALRRYLNRVGPETAEIVLDVARAAEDGANPAWGRPQAVDLPDTPARGDRTLPSDAAERALTSAIGSDPDSVRLTPQIADFRQQSLFSWRSLHVVAEPGGHLAALHELAATNPDYATVVWNSNAHNLQFAVPEPGPGGDPVLRYISEDQALGPLRRPNSDESAALLLDHYLRYRAEGLTDLGFGDWVEQLGPGYFDSVADTERRRRGELPEYRDGVVRFSGNLSHRGIRDVLAQDGPPPAPPHPADVAHRVATRSIPLLPPAGRYPAHFRRESFTLDQFRVDAYLEPDGHGRWRVPAPRGDASMSDVLATRFHGMTDSDPTQLVDRIVRMLDDLAADLNDHGRPRGRFGRFIDRLPLGSGDDSPPVVNRAAIEPDSGEPGFDRMGDGFQLRPPDEDIDSFDMQNERLLGVPGPDEWSGLSPDQVGARLRDELARILDRPDVTTTGFDLPGLNWQVVQEFARGVVDMANRHPHADLDGVTIGALPWSTLMQTQSRLRADGGYHNTIVLNHDHATSAEGIHQRVREAADGGHFYPVARSRPVYYLALHEFGHVLAATGGFDAYTNAERHLLTESKSDPSETYGDWLDQLSDYSIDDGMLEPGEAVAEAFAQVAMLGRDRVSKPVRVLYDLLMDLSGDPSRAANESGARDRDRTDDDGRAQTPVVRRDDADVPFDRLGDDPDAGDGAKKQPADPSRVTPEESGDQDRGGVPVEPTAVGRPPQVRIEVDGDEVALNVRPDGEDRWEVVDENAPLADAAPTSRLRREWQFVRESWPQHVEQIKYPSGSPVGDSKGQAAIADGISGIADLVESSGMPPAPPANPTPPTPDHPVIQAPPEAGGPDPTFLRIGQQLPIWIANREKIPLLGRLSARMRDSAGEHLPMRLPDGQEYQPWYSDVDPDDVRTQLTGDLEVHRVTPEEAREGLLVAFADADAGQRSRIIDALLEHELISPDEADRLADEPPATPQLPESIGPGPEGETLTEAAQRLLGIELTDESLATVQRVIDEQQYRAMRMVGAIEGLAAAAQRFIEEQTMPYSRTDLTGERPESAGLPGRPEPASIEETGRPDDDDRYDDEFDDDYDQAPQRKPSRYADPDPVGRPVPIGGAVSFTDQNPLGRLRDEFLRAFGHDPGLLNTVPIGNGAEPLPEWGDADELGRDDGLRKFFQHALRRDQLRDELATWAASRDVGIDEVSTREAADALLERLRAESMARMARVAEFVATAERLFYPDAEESAPVGTRLGDQAVRVPFANGPERLVIVDGLSSRDHVLAGLLTADPELAGRLERGELVLNYGVAQTDWSGQVRIQPVETPEVRFRREVVDGRELAVTLLRDGDGPWRPVLNADEVAPTPPTDPDAPPRSPAAVLTDLVQTVRDLGLDPLGRTPEELAELIPDLRLDNAVRATQIEALSDFTRSANDIQAFHDISDARSHLATRLGLSQAELTPDTLVAALTDPSTPKALRMQQLVDLVAYVKQLREIDSGAVDAARDRLALRLVSEDTARRMVPKRFIARVELDPRIMALLPPGYVDGPDGKRVYAVSKSGLSAKRLRKLFRMLQRDGQQDLLREALTEYANALHQVDVYSEVPRGDVSADPRVVDGRMPMHDPQAVYSLRDVVAAAMRGREGTDFAQAVAEAAARPDSGPIPSDPSRRPSASRDWARIVGVDITDADDATFAKVYEAYRDGRIERHEGLSPAQLIAELAALRGEVRLRAEQIDALERLLAEFDAAVRAEQLPTDDPGQLPGSPDPTPPQPESGPGRGPADPSQPATGRKPGEQEPDPAARIDAALERESAAVDDAFTRADQKSAAEHERVADDLDQIEGDIDAHTD